jgi:hypothetical protein
MGLTKQHVDGTSRAPMSPCVRLLAADRGEAQHRHAVEQRLARLGSDAGIFV